MGVELSLTVNDIPRPNTVYVSAGDIASIAVQGNGHQQDWVGLNAQVAADTAYVDWRYLNNAQAAMASRLLSCQCPP